jgi:hypothetical protein
MARHTRAVSTHRDFLRSEGLKDKQLDSDLIPVQKAVNQLAKSGEALALAWRAARRLCGAG